MGIVQEKIVFYPTILVLHHFLGGTNGGFRWFLFLPEDLCMFRTGRSRAPGLILHDPRPTCSNWVIFQNCLKIWGFLKVGVPKKIMGFTSGQPHFRKPPAIAAWMLMNAHDWMVGMCCWDIWAVGVAGHAPIFRVIVYIYGHVLRNDCVWIVSYEFRQ